jgi:signal transduction histidine kinase
VKSLRRAILVPTSLLTAIVSAALLLLAWDSARQGRSLERSANEVRAATALAFSLAEATHDEEDWVTLLPPRPGGAQLAHLGEAEGRTAELISRVRLLPLPPRVAAVWSDFERARETLGAIREEVLDARRRDDAPAAERALDKWRLMSGRAEALLDDFTAYHLRRLDRTVAELQRRRTLALAVAGAAIALGFLVAGAFSVGIARTFVRPIVEMARAAERITATGPLEPVAGAARPDEIGVLARAFNGMTERLVTANASLAHAVRAREDFISIASHELKTPLTPLSLRVQQVLRLVREAPGDAVPREEVLRATRTLEKHVASLARLVENLLDVSHITSGSLALRLEQTSVLDVAREALARMSEQLTAARCVARLDCERDVSIRADRERLDQVLANLLGNAAKYAAGAPVVVTVRGEGDGATISVADGGPGISPADRERIFTRFERADGVRSEVSGLGLGLFIAREIVVAHGGELTVESAPGKGAAFLVRLPREPPPAPPARG